MRDPARQADLLLEAVEKRRVGRERVAAERLDRDDVVQVPVMGLVHDAHAPLPEDRLDLVAGGEELADLRLVAPGRAGGAARREGRRRRVRS